MIVAAAVAGPVFGATAPAWGFVLGSAVRLVPQLIPLRAARLPAWPPSPRSGARSCADRWRAASACWRW